MSTGNGSPLLSSSISLRNQTLWFGQIKLYEDHILLTGWTWTGRVREKIPLSEIRKVETWSVPEGPNVIMHVNGSKLRGRIEDGIGLWHWKLKGGDTDIDVVARS